MQVSLLTSRYIVRSGARNGNGERIAAQGVLGNRGAMLLYHYCAGQRMVAVFSSHLAAECRPQKGAPPPPARRFRSRKSWEEGSSQLVSTQSFCTSVPTSPYWRGRACSCGVLRACSFRLEQSSCYSSGDARRRTAERRRAGTVPHLERAAASPTQLQVSKQPYVAPTLVVTGKSGVPSERVGCLLRLL